MFLCKLLFLCVCPALCAFANSTQKTCSNTNYFYEKHLGTATPYRFVANFVDTPVEYKGCEAVKLWGFIRHGTRNPTEKVIKAMSTRLPDIRDLILEKFTTPTSETSNLDMDLFRTWSLKINEKNEKKLTLEGQDEMLLIAERMQHRFPNLLKPAYSETYYKFKYTRSQRTKKSAQFFAAGLFGKQTVKDIEFPEPSLSDPILRFYKLCSKWKTEVKSNPDTLKERQKFESSSVIRNTIKAVNKRLGLKNELTYDDIHLMYTTCAYETAHNKRKRSPWCSPFSLEDIKALEYGEDLKYYWVDGYGHDITRAQACPPITDMLSMFLSKATFPKATFYFTHSGALLKVLSYLELYKDEVKLLAKDFKKNENRKFRISEIDTFGTNLMLVLFKCGKQNKILAMHQEKIVQLPACPNSDLCEINKFIAYYTDDQQCAFDEICENE